MTLFDLEVDREYSLSDLHRDWMQFRSEEPYNHADTFTAELHEILMASVNGRNNCDVIGLTPRETCNYIIRIRKKLKEDLNMNNVTQETIINLNDGCCIVIHRYGVDDYSAWFTHKDELDNETFGSSVRGSFVDIVHEIADVLKEEE